MGRVNAPAATWLLSLMFALSEAEHKSENKSKIDLGELRDCIHLREEVVWDTPYFSLQPCTFLLSVSHRGFDVSSISSSSSNSNLANLSLQCVPVPSSFWKCGVSTGFLHPANLRESLQRLPVCCRNFAQALLTALNWKFHVFLIKKSHLIAANSWAIRGRVCTLPYHSPTGSHLHLVSHLFHIQFKAACLGILHGPFPAIFTDLVPTFSFIEVPGKFSIDFNWTGCSAFFFFFPLWQSHIPTTKFKTTGGWLCYFVVKLKITLDFVRFANRKQLVCFPPGKYTSCVMGLSVKLLWIMHWGLLEQDLGRQNLFCILCYIVDFPFCLLLFSSSEKKKNHNFHMIRKTVDYAMNWNKISGRADLFLLSLLLFS